MSDETFQPHFRRREGLDLLENGFTPADFGRNDPWIPSSSSNLRTRLSDTRDQKHRKETNVVPIL